MIGGTNAYKHTPIVSKRNPESTGSFPPEIISPAVITANANPTIAVRIDRRCIISNELLYSLILNSRCYSDVTIYELTGENPMCTFPIWWMIVIQIDARQTHHNKCSDGLLISQVDEGVTKQARIPICMCEPHVDSVSRYRIFWDNPTNKTRGADCISDVNENKSSQISIPAEGSVDRMRGTAGN